MPRRKSATDYKKAVYIGLGIGILLILITPRCIDVPLKDGTDKANIGEDPQLTFVIDSMRAEGYAVSNHYPVYIRFVKTQLGKDMTRDATAIAKALKSHTGISIKVQLDAEGGSVIVDPDRGVIDPQEIIKK
jgi:hypothetical protein